MSASTGPVAPLPGRVRSVTPRVAVLASVVVAMLAGSSAPTPLYALYQERWHFSAVTTNVVFGVYAVALLLALLVTGRLSDHVGRRPPVLVALAVQVVVMLLFVFVGSVGELLAARLLQGFATGVAVSALGAGLLDADAARGTTANAVAPATGTAVGALLSGLLVQYVPAPARTVYLVLLGVFVAQAIAVARLPESSERRPGAGASLRPRFDVPAVVRAPLLVAAPALVAVWALAGFYGSLGPALVRVVAGSDAAALGGLALAALAGTGAVTVLAVRERPPEQVMRASMVLLVAGAAGTAAGVAVASLPLFFLGTVLAGVGFGGGFQSAVRTVAPLAAPDQRAGVLSVLYVIAYLALGLPAVGAGLSVAHGADLQAAAEVYLFVIALLAGVALFAGASLGRLRPARPVADCVPWCGSC